MHLGLRTFAFAGALLAAMPAMSQELTLYSGRGETLVDPLIRNFEAETGIQVNVRYAGTAELALLLQEEGDASPADLFWAQDAGALGAVADRFAELPEEILDRVPEAYRDRAGRWVATSGRGRVLAYSPERVVDGEIPESVLDLTDEAYRGRVGWAPTNGSFQANISAMRVALGDEATRQWLVGMMENDTRAFGNNTSQIQGIADGEVDFALPNNYYLPRFKADDPDFPVEQVLFEDGDIGNLLLVAGIGVIRTTDDSEAAQRFVEFLLANDAQAFFTGDVHEYPVTAETEGREDMPSFDDVQASAPDVDLNDISDLEGTLELMRDVGLL